MISQREAIFRLSTRARPRLTARLAEGVLVSGLAGSPTKLASVSLYDPDAVQRLAETPALTPDELRQVCRSGLLVVRAAARRGVAQLDHEAKLQAAGGPFCFSPGLRLTLSVLLKRDGFVRLVVTIASYVIEAANITGAVIEPNPRGPLTRLDLSVAGDWQAGLRGVRLVTPPGNRWLLLGPTWLDQTTGTR